MLTTGVDLLNDPDYWPDDDPDIEREKIQMLNRIDQEHPCTIVISWWDYEDGQDEYCTLPEWDPFTDRCAYHNE